jgi:hypothetical protein
MKENISNYIGKHVLIVVKGGHQIKGHVEKMTEKSAVLHKKPCIFVGNGGPIQCETVEVEIKSIQIIGISPG